MSKIYIVVSNVDYEGSETEAVCSSLDLAMAALNDMDHDPYYYYTDSWSIEEWDLDGHGTTVHNQEASRK